MLDIHRYALRNFLIFPFTEIIFLLSILSRTLSLWGMYVAKGATYTMLTIVLRYIYFSAILQTGNNFTDFVFNYL